jgi:hypothetical protein
MAQKVTVALEDDLDGGPADETVRFGIDGAAYEIDLSKKNAAAFRRKLAPFIDHARKAGRGRRRQPGGPRQAGSAAAVSGRGRNRRASRSAPVGASPPALLSNTKPRPSDPDACRGNGRPERIPAQMASALTAGQRRAVEPVPPRSRQEANARIWRVAE